MNTFSQILTILTASLGWLWKAHTISSNLSPTGFSLALGRGQSSSLSDPRDAIYGFLGLADSVVRSRIEPNYEFSLAEILRDVAVQLTLEVDYLLLFNLTEFNINIVDELPS